MNGNALRKNSANLLLLIGWSLVAIAGIIGASGAFVDLSTFAEGRLLESLWNLHDRLALTALSCAAGLIVLAKAIEAPFRSFGSATAQAMPHETQSTDQPQGGLQ